MIAERFPGIAQLPDEDKMALMAEIWQDVMDDNSDGDPVLSELIEQRWQEYRQHPERVSSRSEVKARILAAR